MIESSQSDYGQFRMTSRWQNESDPEIGLASSKELALSVYVSKPNLTIFSSARGLQHKHKQQTNNIK